MIFFSLEKKGIENFWAGEDKGDRDSLDLKQEHLYTERSTNNTMLQTSLGKQASSVAVLLFEPFTQT